MLKLGLLFLSLAFFVPTFSGYAQSPEISEESEVALMQNDTSVKEVVEAPINIQPIIVWVATIPKVGPIIVSAFKWLITIGGIFTALSIAVSGIMLTLSGVLKVPQAIAIWSDSPEWADKFEKWSAAVLKFNNKIQPYLKWISQFNAEKKK